MKASHPEVVAAHRANPGETLRKVRESKNLALSDVAVQLNLTAQALRNLEAGAFDQLPGHTFARGYVRAYAKLMAMDPDQLVTEFDQYTGTDASGSSVSSLARIEEPARVSQSLVKLFSVVALVALGGVGFIWWQGQSQRLGVETAGAGIEHVEVEGADGTTEIHPLAEPEDQAVAEAQAEATLEEMPPMADPAQQPEEAGSAVERAPQAEAPQAPVASETVVPVAPAAPVVSPAPATAPAVPPAAPAAETIAPAAPVASTPLAPAAGEALVNLQFTADCWTQLTDANGKVLLSALKRRGDSVELVGKAPLELRLGYARGAVVLVNGQPVDVASSTHGETARLKLGQ
ncbi:RodZ domain-containing protein [Pseudomonas sp. Gutcm_11s]|uniref:RodZ domain-containing protein n=1 Tax=Pseudomonas sp. Gutcm_11s TaxID=3026088 RepID=UPI0023603B56|nr:RodZ family helix-turn-helix domain-containing protein [Pseudomonas sp. Gutcm_11s]MDD0844741.1 helix-turn-helix domain-containing protein [Pseudomonas sp. Gutcm_11s]